MSLLEELLNGPDAKDRYLQFTQLMNAGGPDPRSSADMGVTSVPGRGIFGNDSVDVLGPDDPRLRSALGMTLARPAMRSLREIAQELGLTGADWGGGYRTPGEQSSLYASKPGVAAPPGSSYHQEGLAIDLAAALQNARVEAAMRQAGWNQLSGEPWHWSYGVSG